MGVVCADCGVVSHGVEDGGGVGMIAGVSHGVVCPFPPLLFALYPPFPPYPPYPPYPPFPPPAATTVAKAKNRLNETNFIAQSQ